MKALARRSLCAAAPLGVLAFWGGLWMAGRLPRGIWALVLGYVGMACCAVLLHASSSCLEPSSARALTENLTAVHVRDFSLCFAVPESA